MRYIWVVFCLFPHVAMADVTVIYRQSDSLVVGWVRPPHSVETEIRNVVHSQLGGKPEDYATIVVDEAAWQTGKVVTVTAAGNVKFEEYSHTVNKQAAISSIRTKLNALGFSNAELDVLVP